MVLSLPIERRVLELCDAVPSLGDCRTAPLTAERARAAVEGSDEEAMIGDGVNMIGEIAQGTEATRDDGTFVSHGIH